MLLAGCSSVSAPSPGMTDAELDDYYALQADVLWEQTLLPDELRPAEAAPQRVTGEEQTEVLVECMNAAGFDNYENQRGGLVVTSVERTDEEFQAEKLAFYTCRSGLRLIDLEPFLLNTAQKDYLYSYYDEVLIPCLIVHGIEVSEAPTHTEFMELRWWWNPYFSVFDPTVRKLDDGVIIAACPPQPAGMPDQGITADYFSNT